MDSRQLYLLESTIKLIQSRGGEIDPYSLNIKLNRYGDSFIDPNFISRSLQELGYIIFGSKGELILTQKGWEFAGFEEI